MDVMYGKSKSAPFIIGWAKRPIRPALISGVCSMKRLGVFLLPLSQVVHKTICWFPFIHLGGERHCESYVFYLRTQSRRAGQGSNSRPSGPKSDVLTTELPRLPCNAWGVEKSVQLWLTGTRKWPHNIQYYVKSQPSFTTSSLDVHVFYHWKLIIHCLSPLEDWKHWFTDTMNPHTTLLLPSKALNVPLRRSGLQNNSES